MRSITRFVAAFSIATLTSSIASAAHVCGTDPNGDYFLSLRTGPGSGYRELARLVEGTYMSIIRSQGAWPYVSAGNQVGYVYSGYVCSN
jgi:uncharacterized protein YraI